MSSWRFGTVSYRCRGCSSTRSRFSVSMGIVCWRTGWVPQGTRWTRHWWTSWRPPRRHCSRLPAEAAARALGSTAGHSPWEIRATAAVVTSSAVVPPAAVVVAVAGMFADEHLDGLVLLRVGARGRFLADDLASVVLVRHELLGDLEVAVPALVAECALRLIHALIGQIRQGERILRTVRDHQRDRRPLRVFPGTRILAEYVACRLVRMLVLTFHLESHGRQPRLGCLETLPRVIGDGDLRWSLTDGDVDLLARLDARAGARLLTLVKH